MTHAILAYDGTDGGAASRRAAVLEAHVAFVEAAAIAGQLRMGLPLQDAAGGRVGSLCIVDGDAAACEAYLAAEPFATGGVWQRVTMHPFRIAPLPYAPWPSPDAAPPEGRSHSVILAFDGIDAAAEARRLAARPAHVARVAPMSLAGTLLFGGAILDAAQSRMIGSIAVTRHATDAAARAWMADDPYVTGDVWRDITLYGSTLRALPYRPLPRG